VIDRPHTIPALERRRVGRSYLIWLPTTDPAPAKLLVDSVWTATCYYPSPISDPALSSISYHPSRCIHHPSIFNHHYHPRTYRNSNSGALEQHNAFVAHRPTACERVDCLPEVSEAMRCCIGPMANPVHRCRRRKQKVISTFALVRLSCR
jgi:hypothetical protein